LRVENLKRVVLRDAEVNEVPIVSTTTKNCSMLIGTGAIFLEMCRGSTVIPRINGKYAHFLGRKLGGKSRKVEKQRDLLKRKRSENARTAGK
jgi:hypothetical protein